MFALHGTAVLEILLGYVAGAVQVVVEILGMKSRIRVNNPASEAPRKYPTATTCQNQITHWLREASRKYCDTAECGLFKELALIVRRFNT